MTARTAPSSAPEGVRLREATPDDAETLAEFAARTFTRTYARGGDGPVAVSRPDDVAAYVGAHFTREQFSVALRDAALVTFVVEVGPARSVDDVAPAWAGYAQLRLRPPLGAPAPCAGAHPREIARLYVDPAWQGRGVAGALMDAVQQRAQAEPGGADPLWLDVYQANERAVAFYRKRGFVVIGEATFTMGAEVQRDWLMVWRG